MYFMLLSMSFYVAALFSFEGALLFPLLVAGYTYLLKRYKIWAALTSAIPFLFLSCAYFLLWFKFSGSQAELIAKIRYLSIGWDAYIATLSYLLNWYLGNLIFSQNIVLIYNVMPVQNYIWLWISLLGDGFPPSLDFRLYIQAHSVVG